MMATESDGQSQGDLLHAGRIVPIRREGNVVYGRSLRRGEEDTGEVVHPELGDRLVVQLVIDSRDIDEQFNPKELGGYRPVANTVWTWYQIATEELGFFLFFFALARRLDAAHALWTLAIQTRDRARREDGIVQRRINFDFLARAEVAIIALSRCYQMVSTLVDKYCSELQVPESVNKTQEPVLQMRNAFEHIDERAEGKVGRKKSDFDVEALTIFDQPDFTQLSILRYKDHELNFETDVIAALRLS